MVTRRKKNELRLTLLELILILISIIYIINCPFTKVEESFSINSINNLLNLKQLPLYDHIEFPGSVPRSFIGPLILSLISSPFLYLGYLLKLWNNDLQVQILVRIVLAITSSLALIFLLRRTKEAFGNQVMKYASLLILTQFHLLFYISRTLPNMFAFPLVQIVLGILISPKSNKTKKGKGSNKEILIGFSILTFTSIIMRLELLALLLPLALMSLKNKTTQLKELILVGMISTIIGLGLTVGIDSYFWGTLVWPEGAGIYFNVIQGHSSDWGTSPFYQYFLISIPRLINLVFPIGIFSMLIDKRSRSIGFPILMFVGLLSCLKHKEWRFLIYILPCLNICGANGICSLGPLFSTRLKKLTLYSILLLNVLLTLITYHASSLNYPGGESHSFLTNLPSINNSTTPIKIHIDSSTCMTGITLFTLPHSTIPSRAWYLTPSSPSLQSTTSIIYSKSETLPIETLKNEFNYLLTGHPELFLPSSSSSSYSDVEVEEGKEKEEWKIIKIIKGFERFNFKEFQVVMKDMVWILEKRF